MTEATNTTPATQEKAPKVVKHIDVRIEEAQENLKAAQAKLDALLQQKNDAAKYDTIAPGLSISFGYGRAEKRRTLQGVVTARVGDDLGVAEGEGLDARILRIKVQDVVFNTEAAA